MFKLNQDQYATFIDNSTSLFDTLLNNCKQVVAINFESFQHLTSDYAVTLKNICTSSNPSDIANHTKKLTADTISNRVNTHQSILKVFQQSTSSINNATQNAVSTVQDCIANFVENIHSTKAPINDFVASAIRVTENATSNSMKLADATVTAAVKNMDAVANSIKSKAHAHS